MFWKLIVDGVSDSEEFVPRDRYSLRRDTCEPGGAETLELHEGDVVRGWKMAGPLCDAAVWASELSSRSSSNRDTRIDPGGESGGYAWEHVGMDGGTLLLERNGEICRIRVERVASLCLESAREIAGVMQEHGVASSDAAGLVADGLAARRNAVERLCGLGRELDSERFNDAVWRKTLAGLRLTDIHEQLRAFEVRFDEKYPPMPVSRPESLDESASVSRDEKAMLILRGDAG